MRKGILKLIALVVALTVLLSGCTMPSLGDILEILNTPQVLTFDEMEYQRPDIDELEEQMQLCCDLAQTETDVNALLEEIWLFFELYNRFETNYNLANVYYFKDMSDTYWENEYNYCLERTSRADAALDELYYTLADSSMREALEQDETFGEGFFDAYSGESIWDETFTAYMDQEAQLQSEYYALIAEAQEVGLFTDAYYDTYSTQLAELFVDMIALRQETAHYAGYDDYQTFAYDFYHYRDYTPEEAEQYLETIGQELVSLYMEANYLPIYEGSKSCTEAQTYAYVKEAAEAMGGTVESAFELLSDRELYDISYGENKYDASFEVYLPSYEAPYVFVNPTGTMRDKLTFTHEFGHFCNEYATYGGISSIDVAEVFSQGLEYLSLFYVEDGQKLEQMVMRDSLNVFVEQAAYALFEHRIYDLEGDALTAENVQAIYEQTCKEFGFDIWVWDSRDYVLVTHFFIAPMYVISYVISNDAAMQLYQLEAAESGSGLALYEQELTTVMPSFMAFVEEAGLESPFAKGRVEKLRRTFEDILGV